MPTRIRGRVLAAFFSVSLSGAFAAAVPGPPAAGPGDHFLSATASERGWDEISDPGGRWYLYTNVDGDLVRETVTVLREFGDRLDQLLGAEDPEGGAQSHGGPLTLALLASQGDVAAVCDAVGGRWDHLAEWARVARDFPRVHHWNPLLAVVKHDPADNIPRPEVQLAHDMVQLEIVRRYGREPYWIGEALGYALQDEIVGGIYGYSYRQAQEISEDYHTGWRYGAKQALAGGPLTVAELARGSGTEFQQRRAYALFALAQWWLNRAPEDVARLLQAFAEKRGAQWAVENDFEPDPAAQDEIVLSVFRKDMFGRMSAYWTGVDDSGGPGALERAVMAAAAGVAAEHELKTKKDRDERLVLFTDFGGSQATRGFKSSQKVLRRLDKILGKPADPAAAPVRAFMITSREAYYALCDALGAADPGLLAPMQRFKHSTGFTIYKPPLTAYFHDVTVQEEATPDQNVAHNVVHMELNRRYGILPLWLAEGIACAVEEEVFGVIWANWNLDGFVYTDSRSAWRRIASDYVATDKDWIRTYDWTGVSHGAQPTMVKKPKPELTDLYAYTARPYVDDMAHMAYALAIYGLEADPEGLAALLEALKAEYASAWTSGGVFQPEPARMAALVEAAFGPDFEQDFRAWWVKPPKRPK